jgi:hypothetical protein
MEDICIVCTDKLATLTFLCQHRSYCQTCHRELRFHAQRTTGEPLRCPICRVIVGNPIDTTTIQLRDVKLKDNLYNYHSLKNNKNYPCGCILSSPMNNTNE